MYGISRAETDIRHQTGKRIRRNDEMGITGNDRTEGLFPANGREKINERHCSEVSEV